MASETTGFGETARMIVRPVVAAAVTGRAGPQPVDRPWPAGLRWTRHIGVGRLRFAHVMQFVDLAVATIVFFGSFSVLQSESKELNPDYSNPGLFLLIALGAAVPLAMRQRHPLGAWRTIALAIALGTPEVHRWMTTPYLPGAAVAAVMILYSVAVRCSRDVTIGVGLISILGALALSTQTAAGAGALILLPLLAGFVVRQRHMARQELAEREEAARRELAEQERRHRDAEAVLTERQRIARELHDVVAHHMSMIAIQAEAAPYKVDGVPEETRKDLAEIRGTALDALNELRRILGVLRSEDGAETAPQPSLDRLDELVAGARQAGLTVTFEEKGERGRVPPGYGLTVYRIVQEGLSNAMRHAPGADVAVAVGYAGDAVRVAVINDPPPSPAPVAAAFGGGHGLIGMRERAAMLGGELDAGPTPEGGFAVRATLPVEKGAT
jgi:signal transduction histidine kinase